MAEKKHKQQPSDIRHILSHDEQVIHAIQQSRLFEKLHPAMIYVTDKRVILKKPALLGLKSNIQDFRYEDISNIKVKHGLMYSDISIVTRSFAEGFVINGIPKQDVKNIHKTLNQGVAGDLRKEKVIIKETKTDSEEYPLKVLKLRYVKGEITKEEFEDMKEALE